MTDKTKIRTIAFQAKIDVIAFDGYVYIEQENEHGGTSDAVLIAPDNIDSLIEALKLAKQQLLAEGL